MRMDEVIEMLKDIKGTYGKFEINERTPARWFNHLEAETTENVLRRLNKHERESKFEPSVSDLLPNKEEREKLYQDHIINLSKGRD